MLLDSITGLSVQPQNIYVYIPYGYDLPKERIGSEVFIRCEKGMVTQRSLPFTEITTPYCLFCDDDISFPSDFVEKLFNELTENEGDCISPDSFKTTQKSIFVQIINLIKWASPRKSDAWAFKINRYTSGYSYNSNPQSNVLKSQSAAFPCFLCKMDVFRSIHFEDERWLDTMLYGEGDDQLFFYKMYLMGYKLLVSFDSCIEHLDGKTSRKGEKERDKFRNSVFIRFCLWYRSCYKLERNGIADKFCCILLFSFKLIVIYLYHAIWSILRMRYYRLVIYIPGLYKAYKFVHSEEYLKYPPYDYRISK